MKKIFLAITILGLLSITQVSAQRRGLANTGPKIGIGVDFAFPQGDFKSVADYAIGGSILYQHPVADKLYITGNVGYLRINGKPVLANIQYNEGYVPIKAGARYYIAGNIYGSGELGVAISTANGSGSGTAFAYAPALGVEIPIADSSIDLGLRYESWSRSSGTRSLIGIRAGFNF